MNSSNQLVSTSAGTCQVTAAIGADNDYNAATSTPTTFTFNRLSQSIAVAPASGPFDTPIALSSSGSSGSGAITFSATDGTATGCAVNSSNQLVSTSAGTCQVTAAIGADNDYNAATSTPTTFTFNRLSQSIAVAPASGPFDTPIALSSSGSSGSGAITFSATDGTATGCAVNSSNQLVSTSAGTCQVTASIAADTDYLGASSDPSTFTFNRLSQSIAVAPASGPFDTPIALSSSGSSGSGAITFSATDGTATGCAVNSSNQLVSTSAGTCQVTASIGADVDHSAATSPEVTDTFNPLVVLTVKASSATVVAGHSFTISSTVSGANPGDNAHLGGVGYVYLGEGSTSYGPSSIAPTKAGLYSVTPTNALVSVTPSTDAPLYSSSVVYVPGTVVISPAPVVVKNLPKKLPPTRKINVGPFGEGSYKLTAQLMHEVSTMAQTIKKMHYTVVQLASYTDNVFSPTFNVTLNQNRATAVQTQLLSDLAALHDQKVSIAIVPGSVAVQLASNTTAKGRASNRHVVATLRAK